MPTAQQTLHLAGFRNALRTAGRSFTFGAATFSGIVSAIPPDDPRLLDEPEGRDRLVVITSDLPAAPPTRGESLGNDVGGTQRIIADDPDDASGLTAFILAAP